jgi:phosphoserine phosphatase/putative flippase GtrA
MRRVPGLGVLYYLPQPERPMNVYDFDGTIYDGDSSVDFYCFVLAKCPVMLLLLPRQLLGMLAYLLRLWSKERMKEAFFSFVPRIPLESMLNEFWESKTHKIKPWYLKQKRSDDLIISASPEFLLAPLVKETLNVRLTASCIDIAGGKFSGKNCYGEEKVKRFRLLFGTERIEAFYGDSLSDAPLAEIAEKSFMVQGDSIVPWQAVKEPFTAKIKRTYVSRDFIVFVFCGGMGTLTNFICSLLISTALNPSLSYICGYCLSLFVAYTLNAKLIFHHPLTFIAFVKFVVSYIPNFLILFGFVLVFLNILGWNKVIVYGMAGLLGLPVTFVLVKLLAFNKEKQRKK